MAKFSGKMEKRLGFTQSKKRVIFFRTAFLACLEIWCRFFLKNGLITIFLCCFFIGSLCDGCTGQSYQLPVLDTVFVRSHWRRTGLALQMLEDFCSSQPSEGILGISFPMSPGMYGGMYTITFKIFKEVFYTNHQGCISFDQNTVKPVIL